MKEQRKQNQYLVFLVFVICSLFSMASVAHADQELPPSVVIGDESGVYASQDGEYYIDIPDAMPGETYKKTITIRALDLEEPFELGLLVSQIESTGPIDFNKHMDMKLLLDDKEIYSGPVLGNGDFDWTLEPLELGSCSFGTDHILEVSFTIDKNLTIEDYKETSRMLFKWTFVGTMDEVPPISSESSESSEPVVDSSQPTGKLPNTGENNRERIYLLIIGGLILLVVALLLKRNNNSSREV